MKILFILRETRADISSDGGTRWLFNVVKAMSGLVERIDILGQQVPGSDPPAFLRECCTRFLSISKERRSYRRLMWFTGWDAAQIDAYNPALAQIARSWTNEIWYDLIVFFRHGTQVYLPYARASHTMIAPLDAPSGVVLTPQSMVERIKYQLDKLMLASSQKSYNRANSVLVVSERDKDLLVASGVVVPILVLPLGVDVDEFSPQLATKRERAILFTGVLDFGPNLDAAIHLVRDIFLPANLAADGVVCRVAGRRSPQSIVELARNEGVELLLDLPDLRPVFDSSMVYVAPMRTGLGMKTKILEAMAMEMPIVGYPLAFNGIAHPEDFALVCENAQQMVASIQRLLASEQLRHELGRKARQYAERHHSIEQVGRAILEYAGQASPLQ